MATDVAVVIAWRDSGCPHRMAAFDYVLRRYETMGIGEIVVSSPEPFTRARAINAAVRALPDGTIVVQSDPDSFLADPQRYLEAVELAAAETGLVAPHDRYLYLSEFSTKFVVADAVAESLPLDEFDCDEYGGPGYGNVTVFGRETWELAGGLDERFPMWGGDDAAFAYACDAFTQPTRRLHGDVIHLYHPRLPESVPGHAGYLEQFEILAAYRDASEAGPEHVRALVANR